MTTNVVRHCRYCQDFLLGPSFGRLASRSNFTIWSKHGAKSAEEIKEEDIRADLEPETKRRVKVSLRTLHRNLHPSTSPVSIELSPLETETEKKREKKSENKWWFCPFGISKIWQDSQQTKHGEKHTFGLKCSM